jgi:hypothetical protein
MTRTTATVVRVSDRVAARILHPRLEAGPNPRESRAVGNRLAERRRLTPSRTLQVRPSRPCEPQAEPSLQATADAAKPSDDSDNRSGALKIRNARHVAQCKACQCVGESWNLNAPDWPRPALRVQRWRSRVRLSQWVTVTVTVSGRCAPFPAGPPGQHFNPAGPSPLPGHGLGLNAASVKA